MSEFQYYEFQAIDRPLTEAEMRVMRDVSSRAEITRTRFTNSYSWGDFKGNPEEWMERWFDAFLYFANWGTHELMLRFPRRVLDPERARRYLTTNLTSINVSDEFIVLHLRSHDEEGGGWMDEDEDDSLLGSIIPVRAEIAAGDDRALYLAWLLGAQSDGFDDGEDGAGDEMLDAAEPPVPPGLGELSASLQAFADFLRVDPDLIAAAAQRSAPAPAEPDAGALREWIATLPEAEKIGLLLDVARGSALAVRAELMNRFRAARDGESNATNPRTLRELLAAAEVIQEIRIRHEKELAARAQAKRERDEAAARELRLQNLASRGEAAWREVDELVALKKPTAYDRAVQMLVDLRALAERDGHAAEVDARIQEIRARNGTKRSFLDRLTQADQASR